jgi:GntR family transcriptional repressor for pyruvate dehydrogenase complex
MYDVLSSRISIKEGSPMSERRTRKKLFEEVSHGLVEMIRNGRIQPGDRIPIESEIADMFQVSRTAVREGVKMLVAIGLLETRPGIGTFVLDGHLGPLRNPIGMANGFKTAELLELLEFRKIVEPETAALSAQRRSPDDINELERCVIELDKGIRLGIKPPEDIGFHLALAKSSKNSAIMDATYLIFRFYENDPSLPIESDLIAHKSIFNAVRDGNSVRAHQAMLDHFIELEKRYRSQEVK